MKICFFTFEAFHGKYGVGSTKIRVHNLIKYWPEASIYRYGDNPDVLIFQKVYCSHDYKFPTNYKGLKILDICDPDWLDNMNIKETIDSVDGITCPTQALADFLAQLTDKPIKIIPDRHDLSEMSGNIKKHKGPIKRAVWFGYSHNIELVQPAIPILEAHDIELTIISNEDPSAWKWASDPDKYHTKCKYIKFDHEELLTELSKHDIAILPKGYRPKDRFKSDNKTTLAWMAGIPVVTDDTTLATFMSPEKRNKEATENYYKVVNEYDCKLSVKEMKEFINELQSRNKTD